MTHLLDRSLLPHYAEPEQLAIRWVAQQSPTTDLQIVVAARVPTVQAWVYRRTPLGSEWLWKL